MLKTDLELGTFLFLFFTSFTSLDQVTCSLLKAKHCRKMTVLCGRTNERLHQKNVWYRSWAGGVTVSAHPQVRNFCLFTLAPQVRHSKLLKKWKCTAHEVNCTWCGPGWDKVQHIVHFCSHSIPSLPCRPTIAHWPANFCTMVKSQIPLSLPEVLSNLHSRQFLCLFLLSLSLHFGSSNLFLPSVSFSHLFSQLLFLSVFHSRDFCRGWGLLSFICSSTVTPIRPSTLSQNLITQKDRMLSLTSHYSVSTQSRIVERAQREDHCDSLLMCECNGSLPKRRANG